MYKILTILISALFLSCCSYHCQRAAISVPFALHPDLPRPFPVHQNYHVGNYCKIHLEGNYAIELIPTDSKILTIDTDRAILPLINIYIRDQTLYIVSLNHLKCVPCAYTRIRIPVQTLNNLYFEGSGSLNGYKLGCPDLKIYLAGNINVNLTGFLALTNLNCSNQNTINICGVNSRCLLLNENNCGQTFISGHVCHLDVNLGSGTCLRAKNLHATFAHIHTRDLSSAEVYVTKDLNAFAEDFSNIYYYTRPHFLAPYMSNSGSVIDMVGCTECCSFR